MVGDKSRHKVEKKSLTWLLARLSPSDHKSDEKERNRLKKNKKNRRKMKGASWCLTSSGCLRLCLPASIWVCGLWGMSVSVCICTDLEFTASRNTSQSIYPPRADPRSNWRLVTITQVVLHLVHGCKYCFLRATVDSTIRFLSHFQVLTEEEQNNKRVCGAVRVSPCARPFVTTALKETDNLSCFMIVFGLSAVPRSTHTHTRTNVIVT